MQTHFRAVVWIAAIYGLFGGTPQVQCASSAEPASGGPTIQEMALTDGETSWNSKPFWAPGEQVYVRAILSGLTRGADGRISVRESLELLDSSGKMLLEARDLFKLERNVPEDLSSIELVNSFLVPEGLASGSYRARVRCEDDLAGTMVTQELIFVVGAEGTAGGLRITRFSLIPDETADGPSGSSAQAEARLVGYQLDSDGRYWIEADVVLIDPSGQLALRWDKVLERRERSEPMGLPLKLSLHLELPNHYAPGDYRLELKVRDRHGRQEVVQSATWTKR